MLVRKPRSPSPDVSSGFPRNASYPKPMTACERAGCKCEGRRQVGYVRRSPAGYVRRSLLGGAHWKPGA
eukprot:513219-Prymnesium_polylepis.1